MHFEKNKLCQNLPEKFIENGYLASGRKRKVIKLLEELTTFDYIYYIIISN